MLLLAAQFSFGAEAAKSNSANPNKMDIDIVSLDEWETNQGRLHVESFIPELASGKNGRTANPVKIRIGYQIHGKVRVNLSHRAGKIAIDVSPDKSGVPDFTKRRMIDIGVGQNQVEFDLPPRKYISSVIADSGKKNNGSVSTNASFEVAGSFNPKRVPPLLYKSNQKFRSEK